MGIPGPVCLVLDYLKFLFLMAFLRFDVVILNPSLGKTALLRDGVFLLLSRLFRIPTVVFLHGWDIEQQESIDSNPKFFRSVFGAASALVVLAEEFQRKLRSWGVTAPVYLSTTKVDDKLLEGFDIDEKSYGKTVLFLARIEPDKGIFLALEAFSKVVVSDPEARLVVAGSGSALEEARACVAARSIPNVEFLGNVTGERLIQVFTESDIYLLPTSYGEGMPTSVLEAMAFGLPVITRPVGGLRDFFENSEMGFMSEALEPQWYADVIGVMFMDPQMMRRVGRYNHAYAKQHFMASRVARNLECILEEVLGSHD